MTHHSISRAGVAGDRMLPLVVRAEWILMPPEVGEVWGGLLRTQKAVAAAVSAELEAAHGLDVTSYDVLRQLALADRSRMRMGELAQRVMLTRSGLSGVVDRLETAGLVQREPTGEDRRGLNARLTARGVRLLRRVTPTVEAALRHHLLDRLDAADIAALRTIWGKLGTAQPPFPVRDADSATC